ncbi:Pericentrin-AKAP-450 domain of centrosomal targeting protein-domain-containing protein [Xylariaceae sp. FL0804]|nr:Pericentrin-AKAP-450 domain of centrosomal targeting protein-domain-containing protein [Xylariaceae sp. FL0804]
MDVVDQRDHEAVIRAADAAQRRHDKELRGMALHMEWMQARFRREEKRRHDGAFTKKYLELQLQIAEACNKADLRALAGIHEQLGIRSPDALLAASRKKNSHPSSPRLASSSSSSSSGAKTNTNTKKKRNLAAFVAVVRAVARMRIDARRWQELEKTRRRLEAAREANNHNNNSNGHNYNHHHHSNGNGNSNKIHGRGSREETRGW